MTQGPEPADSLPETLSLLEAAWLGLVEGVTEFLPVSSTGHLIVANRLLGLQETPLTIGIQLGAISAILLLYHQRLFDAVRAGLDPARRTAGPNLLLQIAVAALPAAVLGLLADDWIEANLFSAELVAVTTAVGGVLLLLAERVVAGRGPGLELAAMPYRLALGIGCVQCLALVPGTSRSAATIVGALLLGLSRPAAAEFSFLVGLPILYGACALKVVTEWELVSGPLLGPFVVGTAVAFGSALLVVRPFVAFLRHHTFLPFAIYRLLAGVALGVGCALGWL